MTAQQRTINILFCGTGGQGVLKAAEVCGWAAVYAGLHAKKSEVHGMAQRGGSVESHVRFGKEVISAKGSSTDIVEASAKAYLNALNRFLFIRKYSARKRVKV